MDVRCIVPRDGKAGEQVGENGPAGVGEFVENETGAGELGKDGEEASASRRFEHEVGWCDCRGDTRDEAQRDWCRELLERLALFGPARVRRQQGRNFLQHWEQRGGRAGASTHGGTEPA
jgi:hypothetical protein